MVKKNRSSKRYQELETGVNPRPRNRSRLATGRSRLHTADAIPSDPVHEEEDPLADATSE